MEQPSEAFGLSSSRSGVVALIAGITVVFGPASNARAQSDDPEVLERRVDELTRELQEAKQGLEAANKEATAANEKLAEAEADRSPIQVGPLTIGGAMRVNYIRGDYEDVSDGPSRGGDGGNFELDTFRINMSLAYRQLIGELEYRWYDGYNFLHTSWLGWRFDDASQIQVGVTRVPFGPGPYGVSQSWFFDQHYYVGLSDDMDLGVKYVTKRGHWDLDLAYFISSEGHWRGSSRDSARYSYDAVKWESGLDQNGNVLDAPYNGYSERNQFNARAIYGLEDISLPTDLGVSLQYGQLDGRRTGNGDHWAASVHMINRLYGFTLATQLTRYEIDIDDDNPLGTDKLIPLGAYDFAWPVATEAWIPAVSLSYKYDTASIPWLDYVLPYIEYSSIIKDESDFNDSQLFILGAAWARGGDYLGRFRGWYIYSDLAFSDGNYFVGNEGDDYSNVFDGVGDFGANGNDEWNYRFNINFGYYF
jgi:hypothetical protein